MAGRRSVTPEEARRLLRVLRRANARDRALITAQWLTGFRISEILSLTIGSILRNGTLVEKIGVAPRNLKGHYGRTRWVPVLPELHRALSTWLNVMARRWELTPDLPLFLSRKSEQDGSARPLDRDSARRIMHAAFARAGIVNDGRLDTHTLRKTWSRHVYQNSGCDIMVLKAALNHSQITSTQRYLEAEEDAVMMAIRKCDFTRRPIRVASAARRATVRPRWWHRTPRNRTAASSESVGAFARKASSCAVQVRPNAGC